MSTISIRLDAETTASIDRLAREQGKSKSEIVREALRQYAKRNGKRFIRTKHFTIASRT